MYFVTAMRRNKKKKNPEVFILHIMSFIWDLISSYEDQNDSDFIFSVLSSSF